MEVEMSRMAKAILGLLGAYLIAQIIFSLWWRMQLDAPVMLYLSFVKDNFGFVPYHDFFDMNMPGTYQAYSLIGHISGFQDLGFRIVDIFLIGSIITITYSWMKSLGRAVALSGGILFGLAYLRLGPDMSLQREFLALVLITIGLKVSSLTRLDTRVKNGFVGIIFGLTATIKPQAAIGLVPILALDIADTWARVKKERYGLLRPFVSCLIPYATGFIIPLLAMFAYLWSKMAMRDFVDIATNYWPIYANLQGAMGLGRLKYLLGHFMNLGGYQLWLAPGMIGIFVSLYGSSMIQAQKRRVILLVLLCIFYGIYPVFSGQFWFYHWILFLYFAIQLSALCLVSQDESASQGRRLFPIAVLLIAIVFSLYPTGVFLDQIRGLPLEPPKGGRVDEIAAYLKSNLKPGDLVQPLDWTGGAVHAMLISKAKLATPFLYDFHFYHNISNPYIQSLKKKFIESLKKSHPRFIIRIFAEDKPWSSGIDTTREFLALQELLDQEYWVVSQGKGYNIYEYHRQNRPDNK
jgi:hypothetical protein